MSALPKYTKVLTLGSAQTENALIGEVIVQEKVDGSQFRFGLDGNSELVMGTRNTTIVREAPEKMFKPIVEYLVSIKDVMAERFAPGTFFFSEYLEKPKHNVLKYDRIPKNHIVLFDCLEDGRWVNRETLKSYASFLDVDLIPEFHKGEVIKEDLKQFLEESSFLGNELIEGIVIKNYVQSIFLGGMIFPLFTKYVREAYKERHDTDWKLKSPKNSLQDFIDGFCNENRWQKAIIHLREKGLLINEPKDIGLLIKEVQRDIEEEEGENIKRFLYKHFLDNILRKSISGLPQYYKDKLLENLK